MTTEELIKYLRKDLTYLDGMADGLGLKPMSVRVEGMKQTINNYEREHFPDQAKNRFSKEDK